MTCINHCCKPSCTLLALILSAIAGVLTAFFQITGTAVLTIPIVWAVLALAVVYLGVLPLTVARADRPESCGCLCRVLTTLLSAILGTILLGSILLATGIVATSVVNAILVGLLMFFLTLTLAETACLVRCLSRCSF